MSLMNLKLKNKLALFHNIIRDQFLYMFVIIWYACAIHILVWIYFFYKPFN